MANNNNKMICRACLSDEQELLNTFFDNPNLMELYMNCTFLQVNNNDNLPKTLCSSCIKQCVSWNSFKEMCTLNETLLLTKQFNCTTTVKTICDDDDMEDDENIYLDNSLESKETKTLELKVEFEEITIKNENELSDEFSQTSQQNQIDTKYETDIWECDSTNEVIYLDDEQTNNLELVDVKNLENPSSFLINLQKSMIECDICNEKFTNKTKIKIHMRKHVSINEKWECFHCKRKYLTESHLLQHNKRGTCELKCYICSKMFETNKELKSHRIKHLEIRPFKCNLCNRSFTKLFFLTAHMGSSHNENNNMEKPFPCKKCNKSFMTNCNLKTHMRIHIEKSFMCSECGKTFSNQNKLKNHMIDHNTEKPFKCLVCMKGFKSNLHLKNHQTIHTGEKPFPCTLCDQTFRQQQSLNCHMLTHTGERPFKCTLCNKTYIQNSKLKLHMRSHTGERPYTCKICYRSFFTSTNLKQHSFIHLDVMPFKCDWCDKGFHRTSHLTKHIRTHTGEKAFKCTECEKGYAEKYQLTMHMELHTDDKPFQCKNCEKSFNREENLKLHQKDHEPIVCSYCNELFVTKTNLNQHIKEIHGIIQPIASYTNPNYQKEYAKRKMECPICKKIISLQNKISHMSTHSERTFKCELCPWSFTKSQYLQQHMISHTVAKPFKCEFCDKTFKRISHRTEHTRIHTGQAPTCNLCNKVYLQKADLIIHMRSHTGEKPFECLECKAAFDSQAKLKKHYFKHENEKLNE